MARPHVVIIGGGFGGLYAAKGLKRAPVRITLVDRENHHLFQPLLYEVATAALSPADIAEPIRRIFSKRRDVTVLLGEARSVDLARRRVELADGAVDYDYLVVATGVTHSYFGNERWAPLAPGLKEVTDALEIRRRFLLSFESAERETDEAARRARLTFVIVGAGPTGVELAGTMSEIARRALPRDFRHIDTATARVVLVEGCDRVLPGFVPALSAKAQRSLENLGVEVRLGRRVTEIDEEGVLIGGERVPAMNVFWAAGVRASPLGATLGADLDDNGRVRVAPDLSVPGHPEAFVVGDLAALEDAATGAAVPGIAPAAMQMARHVARIITRQASGRAAPASGPARPAFRYRDRGMMATVGRAHAVGRILGMNWSGLPAWLLWAVVHVLFLIGFRNRLIVLLRWAWAYLVFQRGARLITGDTELHLERPDNETHRPDP